MNFRKQSADGNKGSIIVDWVSMDDAALFEHLTRTYFSNKEGKYKYGDCFSSMLHFFHNHLQNHKTLEELIENGRTRNSNN